MKKRYLLLLLLFLFIPRVNALTSCSQGRYTDNKTMPMIVFLGNGPSSGYEIQYYSFADTDKAPLQWSYNSFQQLCALGSGSIPSSFNYITFRVTNYLYKKGHIYNIIFSFTDSDPAWNIQPDSLASSNFNIYRIISSKSDPRDKVMYLTVTFESLQDYSGTSDFVFYTSSINTNNFLANTSFMYTPYILDLGYNAQSDLSSIKNTQNNVLSSVQSVQSELIGVKEEQVNTTNAVNDVNNSINNDDVTGAEDSAGGFFNDFTTDTHGLTAVITAPLSLISSITSSSCSPLVIPLPYVDKDLTLPCMGIIYSNYFGSFLSIYQMITFGIVAYWVLVRIFNLVKDFKNPDHDEIEVLDL